MNIFISEADRQSAQRVALRNIAHFFGIPDWDIKNNDTLFSDVSSLTEPQARAIVNLLNDYFKAYDEWFAFYQEKKRIEDQTGIEYNLTSQDHPGGNVY